MKISYYLKRAVVTWIYGDRGNKFLLTANSFLQQVKDHIFFSGDM